MHKFGNAYVSLVLMGLLFKPLGEFTMIELAETVKEVFSLYLLHHSLVMTASIRL